ncbi:MAG: P-loop NTPase fold protein [Alphaproteobacteria bacterium]|nr:P-loop NTPase fold protein [Alphaproteobacteria bacterium]
MNSQYLNDSPIATSADDQYGITSFAESIAKGILGVKNPVGTAIALNGAWGSGKSSAVNLIRSQLEQSNCENLTISEFKCWWYRGEEALALAFLQNLNALLSDTLKGKVKDLIPKIGRGLLQAGPVIGAAVALTSAGSFASLSSATTNFAKRFFGEGDTIEATFQKLAKVLEGEDRRFLIIIDDIDRLSTDEALAIFRLVKSVGRLPNVMYLLVFDRRLADQAVSERHPSEGPHFLEKIIQVGFELPLPLRTDLNRATLTAIESTCGPADEAHVQRIMNLFHDVVVPYLTTPRHVARFQNAISLSWPAISGEVSIADFIALETLRLYEPSTFQAIRTHKESLCGARGRNDIGNQDRDSRFDPFLQSVAEERQETVRIALQRLFPRMEEMLYENGFQAQWETERRVCIEAHFDTYFRMSLSDETLSMTFINQLVERADDAEFIQTAFRDAARTRRRVGTSMVPVLLDELNAHALNIEREKVEPLISSLFEIHDEIDLEVDRERGFMAMADTTLRYHWLIRRLTNGRFTIDERTAVYISACEKASIGWLVDFTASSRGDYRERENGPQREEACLINENAVSPLVDSTLSKIREAASNNTLLSHNDLFYILYRWRDFMGGDPSEVLEWTNLQLNNDNALVIFARQLTGESWSQGMGFAGLGDRVARRQVEARIDEKTDILDITHFRAELERLRASDQLDKTAKGIVNEFLDAWDRRREGHDD